MRSNTWLTSLAIVSSVACGSRVSTDGPVEIPTNDGAAGITPWLEAGQNSTLDAPAQEDSSATVVPPTSSQFLTIDDMEDGKVGVPGLPPGVAAFWWPLGPLGNWFFNATDDLTGPRKDALAENIVPPRSDSKRARRAHGSGLANGTDLFAQLRHPSNAPVDLSPYVGLAFWARLTSASGRLIVALGQNSQGSLLPSKSTDPPIFAQSIAVSDQWERFILLFDDFREGVIGPASSGRVPSAAAVSTIDFVVGLNGEPFDLWIDDLALLCRGVCQ